jgi:hypothetical protein
MYMGIRSSSEPGSEEEKLVKVLEEPIKWIVD